MIDQTSVNIEQLKAQIQRDNDRRYAFYRMLNATDRVLWRLEEMNRDGLKAIPAEVREQIREEIAGLPTPCIDVFRDTEVVQEVLDSVFDIQECLFKWRDPQWSLDEEEDLERLAG